MSNPLEDQAVGYLPNRRAWAESDKMPWRLFRRLVVSLETLSTASAACDASYRPSKLPAVSGLAFQHSRESSRRSTYQATCQGDVFEPRGL